MASAKQFYGFSEEPFGLDPDPGFLFLGDNHRKILFSLQYGLTGKKGFVLLVGERGTGKTTFIRHLLSVLDPPIKVVPIFQPPQTFDELVEFVLRELKVPPEEGKGVSRLRQLDEYLYRSSAQGESLLIIVDEAQNLSGESMEQLRLLCNPDPVRPRFVQGFLVAQPDIDEKLNSYDLRALKQRIVIRRKLGPLTEEESRQYIEGRLKKAGSSLEEVFTPGAAASIWRNSGGIPGVINMLCYFALSTGYVLAQKKIDAPLIEKILPLFVKQQPGLPQPGQSPAMAFIDRLAKTPPMMRISYALLAYSLIIGIVFLLLNLK